MLRKNNKEGMHKSEEKGARTENGRETWGQAMRHRNPGLETGTVMMWRWDGINARNDNV